MGFLSGKKQEVHALAEVLEDGREKMNKEMQRPKFNTYSGGEVFLELNVRVQPKTEPDFDAKMRISMLSMHLLKEGVFVRVKYNPRSPEVVEFDDEPLAILDRNPQLKK